MGEVRVGEQALVYFLGCNDFFEVVLGPDGQAVGVVGARERGRVAARVDVRDLSSGEADDGACFGVLAVETVEVVEVSSCLKRGEVRRRQVKGRPGP